MMAVGRCMVFVAGLVGLVTLSPAAFAADATAPTEGGAVDVTAVWKKNCASCHGEDGKGQTKAGRIKKVQDFTNAEVRAKFDRDRMLKSVKEGIKDDAGKERMKSFADKLSEAEIVTLVDHVINDLK